jgi:hypothetical protein
MQLLLKQSKAKQLSASIMSSMDPYARLVRIPRGTTYFLSLTLSRGNLRPLRILPKALISSQECHPPIGSHRRIINKVIREKKGKV